MDEIHEHHLGQLIAALEDRMPPDTHFILILVRPRQDAIALSDLDEDDVQEVLADIQAVMLAGDDDA